MEGFKEFQGKDLDAAIQEACEYYAVAREKLEIEIVQDAKSGIFGIVGARKAKINARRIHLRETVEGILGRCADNLLGTATSEKECGKKRSKGEREERSRADMTGENAAECESSTKNTCMAALVTEEAVQSKEAVPHISNSCERARNSKEGRHAREERHDAGAVREEKLRRTQTKKENFASAMPGDGENENNREESCRRNGSRRRAERAARFERQEKSERAERSGMTPRGVEHTEDVDEAAQEGFRIVSLAELDAEKLSAVSLEVVSKLISPLVDEVNLAVELAENRVNVMVDCGDASGLLIGREGQTLASLQYLASRIVSRKMDAAVRVHLDAGAYRQRQDEKLHDMALALAARVRTSGRSCSTRPLSSYHRRIVHLALQDLEDIQTRSSGDGAMKRVVILRRKQAEKTSD